MATQTETQNQSVPSVISYADSSLYRGYRFKPYNPDTLVRQKGGLDIYEEMKMYDDQVKAVLTIKKFAVLSPGWIIEPVSGQEDVADFVKKELENLVGGFNSAMREMLTAMEYGFSVTEIVYYPKEDGFIGLKALKTRAPHTFEIETDEKGEVSKLTQKGGWHELTLPIEKFIHYVYGKEFDNPYGNSDLRACYKSYFAKEVISRYWNMFLERFGSPTIKGVWNVDATADDKKRLNDIADRIQTMTYVGIPDTLQLEIMEASRSGAESFENAVSKYNTAIARSVLCPELLGFTDINAGSYSLGKKHFDVFLIMIDEIRHDFAENVINQQLVRRLVDYNFAVTEYPRFRFNIIDDAQKDVLVKSFIEAVNAGTVTPTTADAAYIRKQLGFPEADAGELIEIAPKPQFPPQNPGFFSKEKYGGEGSGRYPKGSGEDKDISVGLKSSGKIDSGTGFLKPAFEGIELPDTKGDLGVGVGDVTGNKQGIIYPFVDVENMSKEKLELYEKEFPERVALCKNLNGISEDVAKEAIARQYALHNSYSHSADDVRVSNAENKFFELQNTYDGDVEKFKQANKDYKPDTKWNDVEDAVALSYASKITQEKLLNSEQENVNGEIIVLYRGGNLRENQIHSFTTDKKVGENFAKKGNGPLRKYNVSITNILFSDETDNASAFNGLESEYVVAVGDPESFDGETVSD